MKTRKQSSRVLLQLLTEEEPAKPQDGMVDVLTLQAWAQQATLFQHEPIDSP